MSEIVALFLRLAVPSEESFELTVAWACGFCGLVRDVDFRLAAC